MTPVVVMAGGRGLRLRELTDHTPKPLVHVGARPMLESIIRHYVGHGFKRFFFCVHYKANLIQDYFGDGGRFGARIRYVYEPEPLGTAGALALMERPDQPFIVTNADILCDYSPGEMMEAHARSGAEITMAVWRYEHQVRYGVAEIDELGALSHLSEKPVWQAAINAGIYVLNPEVLDNAPRGAFHMTDLIEHVEEVNTYPILGAWQDVGTLADLEEAQQIWGES